MLFRPNGVLVNFRLACPHDAVHLERLADLTREVVVGILSLVKVNVCGGEFVVAAAVAAPLLIVFVVALAAADALVFLALVRILIAAAVIVAAGRIEDVHQSGGRNLPSGGLLVT